MNHQLSLNTNSLIAVSRRLAEAQQAFAAAYPGVNVAARQPIHSVYGGAHLFKAETPRKLGKLAMQSIAAYAPNFTLFAQVLGLPGADRLLASDTKAMELAQNLAHTQPTDPAAYQDPARLAFTVYNRVADKLQHEPVEDFRIDFEDGYGYRSDEEEDGHALAVAEQLAEGVNEGHLPPFLGLRLKAFSPEAYPRAVRTLDLVLTNLAARTEGKLPAHFMVTLPKVMLPAQVEALAHVLELLEVRLGLPVGAVRIDLMLETPPALINSRGEIAVRSLVEAGQGRVRSVAFGTFDYTALNDIVAAYQQHTHAAADFARHLIQVSLAGAGITLSDSVTQVLPVPIHRDAPESLTPVQMAENQVAVHQAWKLHYDNIRYSLAHGFYQSWDLHPAQLPVRYAATYAFFLENLAGSSRRLRNLIEQAAQATMIGNTFDDAAMGQGLLNFFLRGLACGALTEAEVLATGITLDELRSRSFAHIVANRSRKTHG